MYIRVQISARLFLSWHALGVALFVQGCEAERGVLGLDVQRLVTMQFQDTRVLHCPKEKAHSSLGCSSESSKSVTKPIKLQLSSAQCWTKYRRLSLRFTLKWNKTNSDLSRGPSGKSVKFTLFTYLLWVWSIHLSSVVQYKDLFSDIARKLEIMQNLS